jgi:hypothetical protein
MGTKDEPEREMKAERVSAKKRKAALRRRREICEALLKVLRGT